VSLEHLWAGWRGEYVASASATEPAVAGGIDSHRLDDPASCVFCRIGADGPPSEDNGILWIGARSYVVLNAFPYASGHLMVLPLRHVGSLGDLTEEEGSEMWSALRQGVASLEAALGPDGVNVGANLGRAAGAGIPGHLHLHAVPRWLGDTNFMTTVAGTRVLPEALTVSWRRIHEAWPA
jgi:ATP adenylyltransferase